VIGHWNCPYIGRQYLDINFPIWHSFRNLLHTAARLRPPPVLCAMLFCELIKFRYHSVRLDHCFVTYGQINQHYSSDNLVSPSWNRSGSMVTINSIFGWRSVTTPSRLVAWHVVAVGYAVGVCTDCVPYRWFNRCYFKQNVQCCRTEAVQGRALAMTASLHCLHVCRFHLTFSLNHTNSAT